MKRPATPGQATADAFHPEYADRNLTRPATLEPGHIAAVEIGMPGGRQKEVRRLKERWPSDETTEYQA